MRAGNFPLYSGGEIIKNSRDRPRTGQHRPNRPSSGHTLADEPNKFTDGKLRRRVPMKVVAGNAKSDPEGNLPPASAAEFGPSTIPPGSWSPPQMYPNGIGLSELGFGRKSELLALFGATGPGFAVSEPIWLPLFAQIRRPNPAAGAESSDPPLDFGLACPTLIVDLMRMELAAIVYPCRGGSSRASSGKLDCLRHDRSHLRHHSAAP